MSGDYDARRSLVRRGIVHPRYFLPERMDERMRAPPQEEEEACFLVLHAAVVPWAANHWRSLS